mgnify:CR=1 FL=1
MRVHWNDRRLDSSKSPNLSRGFGAWYVSEASWILENPAVFTARIVVCAASCAQPTQSLTVRTVFGYIPTGPFDLTDEETVGVPLVRTKQRAYMIAVWAGPWGAHQFFLGNTPAGLVHWLALSTLVGFPSSMGFWTGLSIALLLNIGMLVFALYSMAVMDEDDPKLRGQTSSQYVDRMLWVCKISLWGVDFWRKHRDAHEGDTA